MRKEHDKRSRAFARYQAHKSQQQQHHFYWDGQSQGHGWDEERERQEGARRRHAPGASLPTPQGCSRRSTGAPWGSTCECRGNCNCNRHCLLNV